MIHIILKLINDSHTMYMKALALFTLFIAVWIALLSHEASACNVCHSKNPKMVKMHEELGVKDCFKCHGQGMGKTLEEQKVQMIGDERCIPCHKK